MTNATPLSEVRDPETNSATLQAAMTGHGIYTTLSSRQDVEIVERLKSRTNGNGVLLKGRASRGYTKPTPWPSK